MTRARVIRSSESIYFHKPADTYGGLAVTAKLVPCNEFYNLFMEVSTDTDYGTFSCKVAHIAEENTVFMWNNMGAHSCCYVFSGKISTESKNILTHSYHYGDFEIGLNETICGVFGEGVAIKNLNKTRIENLKRKYAARNKTQATLGLRAILNTDLCGLIGSKMMPEWLEALDREKINKMNGAKFDIDGSRTFMDTFYKMSFTIPDAVYGL